jgi:hypothetical protein
MELQNQIEITSQTVRNITGLTREEVAELMFENAYLWLAHIGADEPAASQFARTAEFWGFWKSAWHEVDREFLRHHHKWQYARTQAAEWYRWFHNPSGAHTNSPRMEHQHHVLIKQLAVKR